MPSRSIIHPRGGLYHHSVRSPAMSCSCGSPSNLRTCSSVVFPGTICSKVSHISSNSSYVISGVGKVDGVDDSISFFDHAQHPVRITAERSAKKISQASDITICRDLLLPRSVPELLTVAIPIFFGIPHPVSRFSKRNLP